MVCCLPVPCTCFGKHIFGLQQMAGMLIQIGKCASAVSSPAEHQVELEVHELMLHFVMNNCACLPGQTCTNFTPANPSQDLHAESSEGHAYLLKPLPGERACPFSLAWPAAVQPGLGPSDWSIDV